MRKILVSCLAFLFLGWPRIATAQQQQQEPGDPFICYPALFALGDDWADTGNARTLYPTDLESQEESSPYGMTFFKAPAHRLSDGRLIVDFLAQAFDIPLLSSYSTGALSDLKHGMSFAVAGSTATLSNLQVPYPLVLQMEWVEKFQSDVLDALAGESSQLLPEPSFFQNALYIIYSGQNDYRYALHKAPSPDVLESLEFNLVPQVVENITTAILTLMETVQARKFMVMSLPPLGCTPEILTLFASTDASDYDDTGCLAKFNSLSRLHNELLSAATDRLRALLTIQDPSFNLTFVDIFSMMSDLLQDPTRHGFTETLLACCGANTGGFKQPYNFHERVMCGKQMVVESVNVSAIACSNPKRYVSWDGIHTTEAFNRYAVNSILDGRFVTPSNAFRCYSSASSDASAPPPPPPTSPPPPPPSPPPPSPLPERG